MLSKPARKPARLWRCHAGGAIKPERQPFYLSASRFRWRRSNHASSLRVIQSLGFAFGAKADDILDPAMRPFCRNPPAVGGIMTDLHDGSGHGLSIPEASKSALKCS